MKVRKAVIPVAGYGTRFLPATKAVPKELLPVVDRPTIHYVVQEAYDAGIREILFVSAAGKSAIENYFDRDLALESFLQSKGKHEQLEQVMEIANMITVHSVRQKEQKGLGHAIGMAKDFVGNEPFAVLLGDDMIDAEQPAIGQLMKVYEKYEKGVIAVDRVPWDKASRYGVVDPEPLEGNVSKIKALVEKPKDPPSNLVIIGRYVLPPEIFEIIENTKSGTGGEIQITDALSTLNGEGGNVLGLEYVGDRHDGGDIWGMLRANIHFALKKPELREKLLPYFKEILEQESGR